MTEFRSLRAPSISIFYFKYPRVQQIWWSSPLSGPKRFEYTEDGNLWFATQNGLSLVPLLAEELSHVLKTNIELKINE